MVNDAGTQFPPKGDLKGNIRRTWDKMRLMK